LGEEICSFEGCERVVHCKRLCDAHYRQMRKGHTLHKIAFRRPLGTPAPPCSFNGCSRPTETKGLCVGHYLQQYNGRKLALLQSHICTPNKIVYDEDDVSCWLVLTGRDGLESGRARIDLADLLRVGKMRWWLEHGYAQARLDGGKSKYTRLQNWIRSPASGCINDHINRDPLDNRKSNLRDATEGENHQNLPGASRKNNTTGYRGVGRTRWGRFSARAGKDYKTYQGGVFDTVEEANEAAIALRNKLFTHNIEES